MRKAPDKGPNMIPGRFGPFIIDMFRDERRLQFTDFIV